MSFAVNQIMGMLDDIQRRRRETHQVKVLYQKDLQIHQLERGANKAAQDRYELLSALIDSQAENAAMAAEIALLRDALAELAPGHPCLEIELMESESRAPARARVFAEYAAKADELNAFINQ